MRRFWTRIGLVLGLLAGFVGASITTASGAPVAGAAGDIDPSFGEAGTVTRDFDNDRGQIALTPHGKIVAAAFDEIVQFNEDGSVDTSFGNAGVVDDPAHFVAVQPDGKIVTCLLINVGGEGPRPIRVQVARYNPDGTPDSTFGSIGKAIADVGTSSAFVDILDLVLHPDGKITLSTNNLDLVRFLPSGQLDASFGSGGVVHTLILPESLVLQVDGKLVVGDGEGTRLQFTRYDSAGAIDTSYGTNGHVVTQAPEFDPSFTRVQDTTIAVDANGRLVATANAGVAGGPVGGLVTVLARYRPSGAPDQSFGQDGTIVGRPGVPGALAVQADNKQLVSLFEPAANGTGQRVVARFNEDGTPDTTFGDGGAVRLGPLPGQGTIVVQPDTKIIVTVSGLTMIRLFGEATADAGGPYTGEEGASIEVAGGVPDPAGPHTWSIFHRIGTDPEGTCSIADPSALETTVECDDDGFYGLKLSTPDGVAALTHIAVRNVRPEVTMAGEIVAAPGKPVTVVAPFTDGGSNDTHTCEVDFGDGTPFVQGTVANSQCTATHTYTSVGALQATVTVSDDDGARGTASGRVVVAQPGEAFAVRATGPVTISPTPHAICPPNSTKTAASVKTGLVNVQGLTASCLTEPTTATTTATATVADVTALAGTIRISGISSTCTAKPTGNTSTSTVGKLNGIPIGTKSTTITVPLVAQVHLNETSTGPDGQHLRNAVRIRTLLGQEIILAGCRLGG